MDKDKLIGTRLDGRYELTELVGEGGMADVYRAVDVLDNRVVAVKILKQEYSESEEFQRRSGTNPRRRHDVPSQYREDLRYGLFRQDAVYRHGVH